MRGSGAAVLRCAGGSLPSGGGCSLRLLDDQVLLKAHVEKGETAGAGVYSEHENGPHLHMWKGPKVGGRNHDNCKPAEL